MIIMGYYTMEIASICPFSGLYRDIVGGIDIGIWLDIWRLHAIHLLGALSLNDESY